MSGPTPQATSGSPSPAERIVVVVAGGPAGPTPRLHPAGEPLLAADDLSAVRGDGCFETMLLTGGAPAKPERHLQRLARSAASLGIDGPDADHWRAGIDLAARRWGPDSEAMLRLVLSRGPEHGGGPTAYITVAPVTAAALRARAEGVDVMTLQRGYSVDLAAAAPWQLLGAKTLSYATNMAALRYAAEHGCQDVLYLSAEGDVLEGPRSTLVIARDGELVSPPAEIGILEGTTLAATAEVATSMPRYPEPRTPTLSGVLDSATNSRIHSASPKL